MDTDDKLDLYDALRAAYCGPPLDRLSAKRAAKRAAEPMPRHPFMSNKRRPPFDGPCTSCGKARYDKVHKAIKP